MDFRGGSDEALSAPSILRAACQKAPRSPWHLVGVSKYLLHLNSFHLGSSPKSWNPQLSHQAGQKSNLKASFYCPFFYFSPEKPLTKLPTLSFGSFWPGCILLRVTSFISTRKTPFCQQKRKCWASSHRAKGGVRRRKGISHRTHLINKTLRSRRPRISKQPFILVLPTLPPPATSRSLDGEEAGASS